MKELSVTSSGVSDIGIIRSENQDSFGEFPKEDQSIYNPKGILFIVADGMGGHYGGKEASQLAVEIIGNEYYSFSSDIASNSLLNAFKKANLRIHQSSLGAPQFQKKGTTCSALVLENNLAHIAHVGDSRIYKISNGKILQLTRDHTEVGEMLLKGILSEEEAKNHPSKSVLVRAMGIEPNIEVDLLENIPVDNGDCFVLCSDGLAKVDIEEIKEIVLNNSPEIATRKLIDLANERGGKDNVTVQVIKIIGAVKADTSIPEVRAGVKNRKGLLVFIFILIIILLTAAGITYKSSIWNLFSYKPDDNNKVSVVKENVPSDAIDNILADANKYLSTGQLDTALALFNFILNEKPLHAGALNGRELVALRYIQRGNQLVSNNNYEEALLNFNKALTLDPYNKELHNKIMSLKNNVNTRPEKTSTQISKAEEVPVQLSESNDNSVPIKEPQLFTSSEWSADGLTEKDYNISGNEIIFFNTSSSKKLFYRQQKEDIDVEVNLHFSGNTADDKGGIIIGYNKTEKTGTDNYYLFTVGSSADFTLLRVYGDKTELLLSVRSSSVLDKMNYRLKIKCLGPWVMLYNENKLLEAYLAKEFIKGMVGLYSESNTRSEFSGLKISSAFEKK